LGVLSLTVPSWFRKPKARALLKVPKTQLQGPDALVFRQHQVALVKSEQGTLALHLRCPHLGCTVSATSNGWVCPCHGSRFDVVGNRTQGPTNQGLTRLAVAESTDYLEVTLPSGEGGLHGT